MTHPSRTIGRSRAADGTPSLKTIVEAAPLKPQTRWRSVRTPDEVTPDTMAAAVRAARGGNPARYFAALRYFHRLDDVIPGALGSLVEAVLQSDDVVAPVDDSDEALRQAEDLRLVLENLDLLELLREGLEARYYGFRAAAPVWEVARLDNGSVVQAPVTYELLPREWVYAETPPGATHSTVHVGDRPYHEYPAGSVLLFSDRKLTSFQGVDFTDHGCGMGCARFAVYSYFNNEDWAGYNEVFGQPTILGTLLAGWNDTDRKLLEDAVFGVSNDARGVLTDKAKIDTLSAGGGAGTAVFDQADQVWRKARSRIIKSEALTDGSGETGTYGLGVTLNSIRLDVARGMARRLARMVQRRLVDPFCALNYGRCLVRVHLPVKEVQNLAAELTIDKGMMDMGLPQATSDLYERYGRRMPDDGEDVVAGKKPGLDPLSLFGGG